MSSCSVLKSGPWLSGHIVYTFLAIRGPSIKRNSSGPATKSFFTLERLPFSKLHSQRAHRWRMLKRVLPVFSPPRVLGWSFLPHGISGSHLWLFFLPLNPAVPPVVLHGVWHRKPQIHLGADPSVFSLPDPPGWCQVGGGGTQFSAFLQLSKLYFMSFNPHERAPN